MSQFFNQKLDENLTLHYNFDTKTAIATVEHQESGLIAKAIFRNLAIAHISYLKSFKDSIKDCLEWAALGSEYRSITLDPEATNVPVLK